MNIPGNLEVATQFGAASRHFPIITLLLRETLNLLTDIQYYVGPDGRWSKLLGLDDRWTTLLDSDGS